jgi:hypothetical protein
LTRRALALTAEAAENPALADADEVIVVDRSPDALLGVLERLRDPRYAFLLGELPILPLPNGWIDVVAGEAREAPARAELDRVTR